MSPQLAKAPTPERLAAIEELDRLGGKDARGVARRHGFASHGSLVRDWQQWRAAQEGAGRAQEAPEGSPAPTLPPDPAEAASASATPAAGGIFGAPPTEAEEGDGADLAALLDRLGITPTQAADAVLMAEAGADAIEREVAAATAEGREVDRARIIAPAVMAKAEEAAARDREALGVEVHPAAALFPMLAGDDFAELVRDVRQHGVREPVTLDAAGRLLDGRNRYAAAKEAGRLADMPEPRRFNGTEAEAVALVVSANVHRRHLDKPQRAMIAARLVTMQRADTLRRGISDPQKPGGLSAAEAAAALRVSPRMVEGARFVLRQGAPEVVAAVEAGALPLHVAETIARQPAEAQPAALAEATKPKAPRSRSNAGAVAAERRKAKAEAQAAASSPAPAASTSTTASPPAEEAPPADPLAALRALVQPAIRAEAIAAARRLPAADRDALAKALRKVAAALAEAAP